MLVLMVISLITSRVILKQLGINDYGIINLVGGFISFLSILGNAMATATQRFLSFEIGKQKNESVSQIFSASMTMYVIIVIIAVLFFETFGLWFVNHVLIIPKERMVAVNWVYQISVVTFCVTILRTPYNATIIANEKMDFYAYVSIVEAVLRLLTLFLLTYTSFDKMAFYAMLTLLSTCLINIVYSLYCKKQFTTTKYKFFYEKRLFKELFSFGGWTLCLSGTLIIVSQGNNIIANHFYGVSVNGAIGIALQVSSMLFGFISNFQTAFRPSIVKLYAQRNIASFFSLIFNTSRYSFLLLYFLTLPTVFLINPIVKIWLGEIPEFLPVFCVLLMITGLFSALAGPISNSMEANGDIKVYQILMSSILLLQIPLSYFALSVNMPIYSIYVVGLLITAFGFFIRIWYLSHKIQFPIHEYFKEVLFKVLVIIVLSVILPLILYFDLKVSLTYYILVLIATVVPNIFLIFFLGLTKNERNKLVMFVKNRFYLTGKKVIKIEVLAESAKPQIKDKGL